MSAGDILVTWSNHFNSDAKTSSSPSLTVFYYHHNRITFPIIKVLFLFNAPSFFFFRFIRLPRSRSFLLRFFNALRSAKLFRIRQRVWKASTKIRFTFSSSTFWLPHPKWRAIAVARISIRLWMTILAVSLNYCTHLLRMLLLRTRYLNSSEYTSLNIIWKGFKIRNVNEKSLITLRAVSLEFYTNFHRLISL